MNPNKCLSQALSPFPQTQHHPGGCGSTRGDDNTANVVLPKAKVGIAFELDLGTGSVRLTDSGDQYSRRIQGADEFIAVLSEIFGPCKTNTTGATADYKSHFQDFVARLRKCLREEKKASTQSEELDHCREKVARFQTLAREFYRKAQTESGREPHVILNAAEAFMRACD